MSTPNGLSCSSTKSAPNTKPSPTVWALSRNVGGRSVLLPFFVGFCVEIIFRLVDTLVQAVADRVRKPR